MEWLKTPVAPAPMILKPLLVSTGTSTHYTDRCTHKTKTCNFLYLPLQVGNRTCTFFEAPDVLFLYKVDIHYGAGPELVAGYLFQSYVRLVGCTRIYGICHADVVWTDTEQILTSLLVRNSVI